MKQSTKDFIADEIAPCLFIYVGFFATVGILALCGVSGRSMMKLGMVVTLIGTGFLWRAIWMESNAKTFKGKLKDFWANRYN